VLIHSTRIVTVVFLVPFAVRLLFDLEGVGKPEPVHASQGLSALDWLVLLGCAALGYVIGRPLKRLCRKFRQETRKGNRLVERSCGEQVKLFRQ
jgi:hypothetical protein